MRRDEQAAAPAAAAARTPAEGLSRSDRIRAYLDDKLDEQALEDLELELFDDPLLLQDLEAERALRDGLRDLDADLQARAERLRPPVPLLRRALPLAAAALVAGALIPTALLLWQRGSEPAATASASLSALRLDRLRNGSAAPTVLLPAGAAGLSLQFARAQPASVRDYRVELSGPDGAVLRFDSLRPGADMLIKADVPGTRLAAGSYTARLLENRSDGSSAEVFVENFILTR